MDAEQFDALARRVEGKTRRLLVGGALAIPLIGGLHVATEARKKKKKKKGKKKKARCDSYYVKACGRDCCSKGYTKCCPAPGKRGGKECTDNSHKCCPASFGGGSCYSNETCCPPRKGEIDANCVNAALGYKCCPLNSGGYCDYDENCCPSETTNSNNYGCCQSGRSCCNYDSDCPLGWECSGGCCYNW